MKIILVHKFWRKTGGAENYFQDTASVLRANGHEVKIFTTDFPAAGSEDVFEKTNTVVFGSYINYLEGNIFKKIRAVPGIIYSKKNKEIFSRLLDDFLPDIVHVFAIYTTITPSVLEACTERKIPVVMSCNDYKHICPNYRLFYNGQVCEACKGNKFYNAVLKNCCKHSFGVSLTSAIESYSHENTGIVKKNVSAFLFESNFMLNKTREFWGDNFQYYFAGKPFDVDKIIPSDNFSDYLLFAGRLSDEKGVDILLRAMQKIPHIKLKIAGNGLQRNALEKLASQLHLKNIEFMGNLTSEEMKNVTGKCRFMVIPSVWYENFPYTLAEAYASGKAVVASRIGGITEYVRDGETGFLYDSLNHNKLAEQIEKLYSNTESCRQMGTNARKFAEENFNRTLFYNRLSDIYLKVTTAKTRPEKSQVLIQE